MTALQPYVSPAHTHRSTGAPTPVPTAPPNAAPVRRHLIENESLVMAGAHAKQLREDQGPPGPSPETVLRGIGASSPTDMSATNVSTSHTGSVIIGKPPKPSIDARVVPARIRALQAATGKIPPLTSFRPGSAGTTGKASPSPITAFEQEIMDIEASNITAPSGRTSVQPFTSTGFPKQQGSATPGNRQVNTSTSRTNSPSLEDYEVVEGELPEPFLRTEAIEEQQLEGHTTATGKPIHVPYTPDLRAKLTAATSMKAKLAPKPMVLKDFIILAEACQRAGRARMEGHAYYKIAEIYAKNKDTHTKAISYFKRYLNISRRLNDLQGEAKALNCLGNIHYEMGGTNNMHIALEFHKQHSEIADAAGIFIANTNMGLIYSRLDNTQAAMECHKLALQYAVRAGDKTAESLALANLGLTGTKQGDFSTAKVCVERQLELATTLQDSQGSCDAYEQLGVLCSQRGDFASAADNFLLALDVAIRDGNQERTKQLRCKVGYAQGMLKIEEKMKTTVGRMSSMA